MIEERELTGRIKAIKRSYCFIETKIGDMYLELKGLNFKPRKDMEVTVRRYTKSPNGLRATEVYRKAFPYFFVKRPAYEPVSLKNTHEELHKDCYDVAFELEWTALTPIALNPCFLSDIPENMPDAGEDGYSGYNRCWLYIQGRPVISSFTVKSAIANAYANFVGGCYRVNDRIEGHSDYRKGQYPYPGAFKRYRVSRSFSKPGIIRELSGPEDDGSYRIVIQPVEEYYLDEDRTDLNLHREYKLYIKDYIKELRDRKPPIVTFNKKEKSIELKYGGPYCMGMEQKPHRTHKHRFYIENGTPIEGRIRKEYFNSEEELKRVVYLGGRDEKDRSIPLWYQDLTNLKVGDFIYYSAFGDRVWHIGKNYEFKALFYHPDTIPEGFSACHDPQLVCPRCNLFGFLFQGVAEAGGFKGRFLSSNLIADREVKEQRLIKYKVPVVSSENKIEKHPVEIRCFYDSNGKEIGRQFLLPVLGPPKPNKQDVDGYFEPQTGLLKGAKVYRHASLNSEALRNLLKRTDTTRTVRIGKKEVPYPHNLRSWAEVFYEGITFSGTVGAENVSLSELTALFIILNSEPEWLKITQKFKLGIGKSVGLGSVRSRIKKIWLREPSTYRWKEFEFSTWEGFLNDLEKQGFSTIKNQLKEEMQKWQKVETIEEGIILNYPPPGHDYWEKAKNTGLFP